MVITNCSRHVSTDRLDRSVEILTVVGLGHEVFRRTFADHNNRYCTRALTSTGVMLCYNADTGKLITMFMPCMRAVKELYGRNPIPSNVRNLTKRNSQRYKYLLWWEEN